MIVPAGIFSSGLVAGGWAGAACTGIRMTGRWAQAAGVDTTQAARVKARRIGLGGRIAAWLGIWSSPW
ncbi:hypothetical protein GCM10010983_29310 [Caulobacter rhizosphaerae]|nr:hypothetical protein GCM10010983_29310 [Caulobacter rhizosphaerae]